MCRSGADASAARSAARPPRRGPRAILLALAVTLAFVSQASAAPDAGSSFELTRGTQRTLYRLQESWLRWVGAIYGDNPQSAEQALVALEGNARQIGMTRLVDFSLGAVAMALSATAESDRSRVDAALAAAERLDPGRPETAFARATIERRRGAHFAALRSSAAGWWRLTKVPESRLLFADLTFWLVAVWLVAGGLFVLVQVATKGSAVIADLRRALSKHLSSATVWLVTALVLLWPLVLPGGPLWLLLYWSALLWGYGSRSERAIAVVIWVVAGAGPWLAARSVERISIALSPPMRAVTNFGEGRLYGGLFADLEVLMSAAGEQPAAQQLLADVYRTLGQWDEARALYRQIQETEPRNAAILINLGAYQFRKGDFALANDYFRQAAAIEPPSAGAHYNLSLSYSESYQFEESRQALAEARRINSRRVDQWVKTPSPDRVLSFDGGLDRVDEIERALVAEWIAKPRADGSPRSRGGLWSAIAVTLTVLTAFGIAMLRSGRGYSEPASWLGWRAGTVSRWLRAFFPALSQAELGEGAKAFGSLLALSAVALAPRLLSLGAELPIFGGMPSRLPWALAVLGLAAYLALCVRAELAEGR